MGYIGNCHVAHLYIFTMLNNTVLSVGLWLGVGEADVADVVAGDG